ncbi:ABC transporter substrate-binding protein [Candidatus Acetothermia bacterium]|nr:ABC transporter substrate-binding protein [Candidatus Acetothermia bacterium]MBI3644113.1 ABC transporter substrate-binding protein [Candidatus Acetothermia bacterium]
MFKDLSLAKKSVSRRTLLKGMGLAVGASVISGPIWSFAQSGMLMGACIPLTGGLASFGPRFSVAADIAKEEINAAGGIPGVGPLTILVRDDGTNPDTGVAAATDLINVNKVPAIFGAAASGVTIPISSVTIANGVLLISPSATSPAISNLKDNDLVWRTAPPDSLQGIVLADLAFNKKGYRKISIIARNDAYGEGLADSLRDNFTKLGGTVLNLSLYDTKATDYSAEIAAARAGSPEAISLITFNEGEQLLTQMVQAGVTNFDLFVDGNKDQDLMTRVAKAIGVALLKGKVGTAPATATTAGGAEFTAKYRARLNEDPFVFTPHSFDAIAVTALAAARAKGQGQAITGANLAANLRSVANTPGTEYTIGQLGAALADAAAGKDINYQGVSGPVEFDSHGDPFGPVGTWTIDENGKIVDTATVDCGFDASGGPFCGKLP